MLDLDDLIQLLDIFAFDKDCPNAELVGNGVCNDESNNANCNFDGGDCITTTMSTSTTTLSTTHDPGNYESALLFFDFVLRSNFKNYLRH